MQAMPVTLKPVDVLPLSSLKLSGPVTVLALGPTGTLARLLKKRPALRAKISEVVLSGAPGPRRSWNARFDPASWAALARSGLALRYIVHGPASKKPDAWAAAPPARGEAAASPAAALLSTLLARPAVARHYAVQLADLTDELALFYLLKPSLFSPREPRTGPVQVLDPLHREGLFRLYRQVLLKTN